MSGEWMTINIVTSSLKHSDGTTTPAQAILSDGSDVVPGTIALNLFNPNMDVWADVGVLLTPAEARALAAALVGLADEIEQE